MPYKQPPRRTSFPSPTIARCSRQPASQHVTTVDEFQPPKALDGLGRKRPNPRAARRSGSHAAQPGLQNRCCIFLDHTLRAMYNLAIRSVSHAHARRCTVYGIRAIPSRQISSGHPLVRPAPPPLPREQQREFEELVRSAQAPLSNPNRVDPSEKEADMAMHPDARAPIVPEFEGDVNPVTGEKGGPKREPVGKWGEGEGDWSFKGRVSDF
ncbi:hypothetical protein BN946_scf184979.g15 [Trametes cinnabarina]|uniref:Succinate dehydrogenase assembly factor 4, mitochondrial n=1 Tax=Pycnoporus cinnabarinus TaxID=5643 RepID=A0A060SJ85_PYCCI|nr:hypothetical protein BN946_scf184979.g15 [Trametes cinnabarina]